MAADALDSKAAVELALFRLGPDDTSSLPETEPPAWAFFEDLNNPTSSTAIRTGGSRLIGEA